MPAGHLEKASTLSNVKGFYINLCTAGIFHYEEAPYKDLCASSKLLHVFC